MSSYNYNLLFSLTVKFKIRKENVVLILHQFPKLTLACPKFIQQGDLPSQVIQGSPSQWVWGGFLWGAWRVLKKQKQKMPAKEKRRRGNRQHTRPTPCSEDQMLCLHCWAHCTTTHSGRAVLTQDFLTDVSSGSLPEILPAVNDISPIYYSSLYCARGSHN